MLRTILIRLTWVLATVVCLNTPAAESPAWEQLPPLPDKLGFAGSYAGSHDGALLVAGGANFPGKPPWEGGAKVWHDAVFVLEQPGGRWKAAGRLPRPLGYGVSLTVGDGILCVGGSDAQNHYADVFVLRWEQGRIVINPLPPLPRPCANLCGALVGKVAYLAGGLEAPASTNALRTFWSINLAAAQPRWQELEAWPGPGRMLAVAAGLDAKFFLASGAELLVDKEGKTVRRYLRDAYCYEPGTGWKRIADLPRATVAAPTPAPVLQPSSFVVLGGDDGSQISLQPPNQHPGFLKTVLAYRAETDTWEAAGETPFAHVTTPMVPWNRGFVVPGGEIRPGVRSTAVWFLKTRGGGTAR